MANLAVSWCGNGIIIKKFLGTYEILPGSNQQELEDARISVERQIERRERDLRTAERSAQSASRKANTQKSRVRGKLFSTSRSLRGIRADMASFGSNMAENKVRDIERDLNSLHDLLSQLADQIAFYEDVQLTRLRTFTAAPDDSQETSSSKSNFCSNCGAAVNSSHYFCYACGKELLQNV